MQRVSNGILLVISILISLVILGMTESDFLTSIGLGFCVYMFLIYIRRLGDSIPILEFLILVASMQWVFGPFNSYSFETQHYRYFMYVDQEEYMRLAVPGILFLYIGLLTFSNSFNIKEVNESLETWVKNNPKLPYYLIAIGVFSPIFGLVLPAAFNFVVFLLKNFRFIGLALLLFNRGAKNRWLIFFSIMGFTALLSIQSGMFHDLILWSALMFGFVSLELRLSFSKRLFFIIVGLLVVFIIQSVKADFREAIWERAITNKKPTEIFRDLVEKRITNFGELLKEDYLAEVNVRLNQGWIISAIMANTPENEPYAEGETIMEALQASLLPRFLAPNKKIAGGQENFMRFTGLQLGRTTSMGTSVLGEAYANFGVYGAWVFMFVWGAFLSWGFSKLVNYGKEHPIIFVFLPLIFLQVIKAETELVVVLNHFVKSLILVFGFLWFARRFFKWDV